MNEFQATGLLILLFALRFVVPILFTIGLGYLMNRLVDHWEAEEEAVQKGEAKPASPERAISLPKIDIPCWVFRNCEPSSRIDCPAFQNSALPCWLARMEAEGSMPKACASCPLYQRAQPAF